MTGNYLIAGRHIRISSCYVDVHELCDDYRYDGDGIPDIEIVTKQDDIDFERRRSERTAIAEGRSSFGSSDGYLETLAGYRVIAEQMPKWHTMLFHGSAVSVDGVGYMFAAPSGTGKSTHARLWRELLGERAAMVNDDKPLVQLTEDGVTVWGTPWNGKHGLGTNAHVPLRAICLLGRGSDNHIEALPAAEAYPRILRQVYRPVDRKALAATLDLIDGLLKRVDVWKLSCTVDLQAAQLAYDTMRGSEP